MYGRAMCFHVAFLILLGKFVLRGARIAMRFLERRDSQPPLFDIYEKVMNGL